MSKANREVHLPVTYNIQCGSNDIIINECGHIEIHECLNDTEWYGDHEGDVERLMKVKSRLWVNGWSMRRLAVAIERVADKMEEKEAELVKKEAKAKATEKKTTKKKATKKKAKKKAK